MSTKLNKAILKVAQQNPEFAKALTAELGKTAAVDKVPIFSKFEKKVTVKDLEKMMLKHYPDAVPGSLQLLPKLSSYDSGSRGTQFVNFTMDTTHPNDSEFGLTGSVTTSIENNRNSIRVYSYVNIDG